MEFTKRVPDEFGIIVPKNNGIYWKKQAGGMSCIQRKLEGVYIPIGKIRYNLGSPDWSPEGPGFEEKLRDIDNIQCLVEDDSELPKAVRERGKFETVDEYRQWKSNSEKYGWITLWDDLRRFTYGIFELLDSDPRERWDSKEELWDEIDNSFSFTYERINPYDYDTSRFGFDINEYPGPEPAIQLIKITGSKTYDGKILSQWAEDLKGKYVFLMCPNAD